VIAHQFCVEAETQLAGERGIEGVAFALLRGRAGRLAVGVGRHDEAEDVAEVPVMAGELRGEEIEQFRV